MSWCTQITVYMYIYSLNDDALSSVCVMTSTKNCIKNKTKQVHDKSWTYMYMYVHVVDPIRLKPW